MRQKTGSRPRPHGEVGKGAAESTPHEIATLVAQGDESAAGRLRDLAEGGDRALAKAARRALYTLKQVGIEPPVRAEPSATRVGPRATVAQHALLTNPDSRGSQMLLFVQDDPYGGSPWLMDFLINYRTGLMDLGGGKMPRREMAASFAQLRAKPGHLLVDAPVDYVRHLLKEAVARNVETTTPIPEGYAELLKRVGPPEQEYARPLIYEYLDAESVRNDLSISHEPDRLFETDYFRGWLLDLRAVAPWGEKYQEARQTRLVLAEWQLSQRGERVIDDATDALLAGSGIRTYRRLLEETALVLYIADQQEMAKQALYHALGLVDDLPPHTQRFARALAKRSILVLVARDEEEEEDGEEETPSLIARI